MSTQTTPQMPFNQWQNFYPAQGPSFPAYGSYDQAATINDQIYATVTGNAERAKQLSESQTYGAVIGNAERAKQLSESQIYATVTGNAERSKQQAANDIARDILRAVDHNGANNSHITEINAAQVTSAVERNGQMGMSTTERVNSQLATAVERNGAVNSHITELSSANLASAIERNGANGMSTTERVNSQLATAVERNGANNMAAIERTTGEARLTTVIADAASRQAANDSTRDVLRTVDRVGSEAVGSTKDSFATLLGTSERIAGEARIQTLTSSGILDNSLRDVRYSILNDVNRVGNEMISAGVQNFNVLSKSVTDGAWENRSALSVGFQNISEEHLRTKFDLNKTMDCHYSSLMLEQQKLGHFMSAKADGHFASSQLEMQKVKEGITMQASNNFAINQLEMQKVKEGLACQAANNFAINQLDAHKNREAIQKDLAEARYEALKSQQYLTDKMGECCCSIKEKMDLIDRDRLRDNLIVSREDNNVLKILEFGGLQGGYGRGFGYGGRGRGSRGNRDDERR
jgi:hypothetical protein